MHSDEYVKTVSPLDTPTVRTLGCVNSRPAGMRPGFSSLGTHTTMLLNLALVIVVLSLLLTGVIGEQEVRGVPTRAR
jgi:hypothetical protein